MNLPYSIFHPLYLSTTLTGSELLKHLQEVVAMETGNWSQGQAVLPTEWWRGKLLGPAWTFSWSIINVNRGNAALSRARQGS